VSDPARTARHLVAQPCYETQRVEAAFADGRLSIIVVLECVRRGIRPSRTQ